MLQITVRKHNCIKSTIASAVITLCLGGSYEDIFPGHQFHLD